MEDFIAKLVSTKIITNSKMIQLIKGGCFTELHNSDRTKTMEWYLRNYVFEPCSNLTMQQFKKMQELEFIPDSMNLPLRMINFKNYVLDDEGLYEKHIEEGKKIPKRGYHDGYYILDNNSQPFFKQHFTENSVVDIRGEFYIVSEKKFTKEVDSYIQPLKDWMALPSTLEEYNERLFQELWKKHAEGTVPHWNMEALCYYDGEHELEHVNEQMYGIVNFFELPEEPEPYEWYTRYIDGKPKAIPKYKISRIAGVVLNSDNSHHMITILTKYGVVNIKHNKGQYAFYNKTISKVGEDGKKKRLEESWLKRGNQIIVSGYRRDDQFRPLVYSDTIYKHTVNLIKEVHEDGSLLIQSERTKVETE
jgi:DNA polymerase-3 subunit alpha